MEKTFEYIARGDIIPTRNIRMRRLADIYYARLNNNLSIYGTEEGKALKAEPVQSKPREASQ